MSLKLPYIQVTGETWQKAMELAAILNVPMGVAFLMICDLWSWGLSLGSPDEPPTGEFTGSYAVARLAGACRWTGDRTVLKEALEQLGLIVFTDEGLRVRGMDRYKTAWEKNRRRKPGGLVPVTGENPPGNRAKPERKTQTQTQTQIKGLETLSAEPPGPVPADLQAAWNELKAPEQPAWREMPAKREDSARARLKERPLSEWRAVISRLAKSSFARGLKASASGETWVADPTFLLRPDSATKTLEGKYDDRATSTGPPKGAATAAEKNWDGPVKTITTEYGEELDLG